MMMTGKKNLNRGMSLIELMISLVIGAILVGGAITVYVKSKDSYRVNESMARIQENARLALSILGPDIRMSNFWGRSSNPSMVQGGAAATDPVPPGMTVAGECRVNWAIDVANYIEGFNNGFPPAACAPFGAGASANSDVLVTRHASSFASVPTNNRVQIHSSRMQSDLYSNGAQPGGYPLTAQTANLIANGYYISQDSGPGPAPFGSGIGVPSLRRKSLAAGMTVQDQEVSNGVEDMQVQFGITTSPVGAATRGSISRWINPGDPIIDPLSGGFNPNAKIIAVKVWLLLRGERPEVGFTNTTNFVYADQNVTFNDGFRRLLVSETYQMRNTWMN